MAKLSEPQSLHLLEIGILGKGGDVWLACPAAALDELWVEQVPYKECRVTCLSHSTAVLSRGQGHGVNASVGHRHPGHLVPSIYSPGPAQPPSFLSHPSPTRV